MSVSTEVCWVKAERTVAGEPELVVSDNDQVLQVIADFAGSLPPQFRRRNPESSEDWGDDLTATGQLRRKGRSMCGSGGLPPYRIDNDFAMFLGYQVIEGLTRLVIMVFGAGWVPGRIEAYESLADAKLQWELD